MRKCAISYLCCLVGVLLVPQSRAAENKPCTDLDPTGIQTVVQAVKAIKAVTDCLNHQKIEVDRTFVQPGQRLNRNVAAIDFVVFASGTQTAVVDPKGPTKDFSLGNCSGGVSDVGQITANCSATGTPGLVVYAIYHRP